MSYENEKLMNLEDGRELLKVLDGRKANAIEESNTTPSAVMSFSDGADGIPMGIEVAIEPVQDLHGYDKPWVGGAGKNLIDDTLRNAAGNYLYIGGSNIRLSTGTYTFSSNIAVSCGAFMTDNGEQKTLWSSGTGTGVKSATFTVDTDNALITIWFYKSGGVTSENILYAQLESGSTATDYEPYSNICPISGWTEANVTREGADVVDDSEWDIVSGQYIDSSDGSIKSASGYSYTNNYVNVEEGKEYTYYNKKLATTSTIGAYAILYDKNKNLLANRAITLLEATKNAATIQTSFTVPEGVAYIRFDNPSATEGRLRLVSGVTVVYTITFPSEAGTVYGGTLKVNKDGSGTLVVERCQYSLTGNEAFDVVTANGQRRYQSGNIVSVLGLPAASTEAEDITSQISSHMVALNSNSGTFGHFRVVSVMIFNDSESAFADATAFKAYLSGQYSAGTPVQVVYKLATPVTYSLTTEQVIKTLLGVNNIWADTGEINSVEYPADTKSYIDNLFSGITSAEGQTF